jgi:hypothetical protein
MKITFLLLALLCTLTISAQQYDLKLNLQKGQHYNQLMTMNMDMSQSIAGQDVNIKTSMQFEFAQIVKSITKNGDFVIENEYSHIVIDMDAMGQAMNYDSKVKDTTGNEAMKTYSDAFGKIIGKKFNVTISPKGKVKEISGLKEIMSSLKKAASEPAAKKILEETFDEKKMISNYESVYHIFPDNPVKVGDTWSQKSTVESIIPIDITTNYSLQNVSNGVAKIAASGDFTMKSDDMEVAGIKMAANLAGKYDGLYQMNITSGMSNTSSINMPLSGTMEVMGLEFPVSINTVTKTKTTPVN